MKTLLQVDQVSVQLVCFLVLQFMLLIGFLELQVLVHFKDLCAPDSWLHVIDHSVDLESQLIVLCFFGFQFVLDLDNILFQMVD